MNKEVEILIDELASKMATNDLMYDARLRYITIFTQKVEKLFAIPYVVGRSEQFFCNCGFNSSTFQLETGEICCCNCEKEIAK